MSDSDFLHTVIERERVNKYNELAAAVDLTHFIYFYGPFFRCKTNVSSKVKQSLNTVWYIRTDLVNLVLVTYAEASGDVSKHM